MPVIKYIFINGKDSYGLIRIKMNCPSTPGSCTSSSRLVYKNQNGFSQCQRYHDKEWAWPRTLCFVSKEDLDSIPEDIKKQIYSYLRKTIKW